jgi:hypothetical protein
MSIIKIIEQIETGVLEAKNNGTEEINVDKMLNYLSILKNSAEVKLEVVKDTARYEHERNLEHYKANNQIKISNLDVLSRGGLNMANSIIEAGLSALKSVILINGGAAIALLAFLGNAWDKGIQANGVSALIASLSLFSKGVLAGALGMGCRYFSQAFYGYVNNKEIERLVSSFDKQDPVQRPEYKAECAGKVFQALSILSGLAAFYFFYEGTSASGSAFLSHFK